MIRQAGFYWIQLLDGTWEVARYDDCKKWYLVGSDEVFNDDDFNTIDSNRIERR